MIKVLFLLECDECRMPNTTVLASSVFDEDQWKGWLYEMPHAAERFSGWKIADGVHLCPICFDELSYCAVIDSD